MAQISRKYRQDEFIDLGRKALCMSQGVELRNLRWGHLVQKLVEIFQDCCKITPKNVCGPSTLAQSTQNLQVYRKHQKLAPGMQIPTFGQHNPRLFR